MDDLDGSLNVALGAHLAEAEMALRAMLAAEEAPARRLDVLDNDPDANPVELREALLEMAQWHEENAEWATSASLRWRALELADKPSPAETGAVATALMLMGEHAAAEKLTRHRLARAYQAEPGAVTHLLRTLGALAELQGRAHEAERLYRRVLGLAWDVLPETWYQHIRAYRFEDDLANLSRVLLAQGRNDAAEDVLKRALRSLKERGDDKHLTSATVIAGLARLSEARRDPRRSRAFNDLCGQLLDLWEEVPLPAHPDVARWLDVEAHILRGTGVAAVAARLEARCVDLREFLSSGQSLG